MSDYKFKIINLKQSNNNIEEANEVYRQWHKVFGGVLGAKGEALDPNDYFRQDLAFVLKHESEFIGFCFGTFFNLQLANHWHQHYMEVLPKDCLEILNQRGDSKLMSIEYLTIHPEWRKTQANVNWSEVMLSLALLKSDEAEMNGVIATPRIDVKVNETLCRLGAKTLRPEINKMNYICSLEFLPREKSRQFPSPQTTDMVQSLWQNRTNIDENTNPIRFPKAA